MYKVNSSLNEMMEVDTLFYIYLVVI